MTVAKTLRKRNANSELASCHSIFSGLPSFI